MIWMIHDRTVNENISQSHEGSLLPIVYINYTNSYDFIDH